MPRCPQALRRRVLLAEGTSPELAILLLWEKVATSLVLPLGTVLVLGTAALLALVRKRRRLGGALAGAAFLWLWMCSTPVAGVLLIGPLVGQFPPQRIEELPRADAIVVLGGAILSIDLLDCQLADSM